MDAHTFVPVGWLSTILNAVAKYNTNPYSDTIYVEVMGSIYGAIGGSEETQSLPPDEDEILEYHYAYNGPMIHNQVMPLPRPISQNPVPVQLQTGMFYIIGLDYFAEIGGWDEGMARPRMRAPRTQI